MKKIFLFTIFFAIFLISGKSSQVQAALCCPDGYSTSWLICPFGTDTDAQCCKWNGLLDYTIVNKIRCAEELPPANIRAGKPVTKEVLDSLNPLIQLQAEEDSVLAEELSTPGGIISRLLGKFAFPLAGLILFVMLIWGGIEMMAGSATSKSIDAGKQRITSALLGFLLLFASFWIARILEIMFGIKIL